MMTITKITAVKAITMMMSETMTITVKDMATMVTLKRIKLFK